MNTDLLRQRRNLIALSIALLLFKLSDTPIDKLVIFGAELKISSFYSLQTLALLFVGYFLIRYYQYLKSAGDLGIESYIDSQFRHKASQHFFREAGIGAIAGEIRVRRERLRWTYSIHHGSVNHEPIERDLGSLPLLNSWLWRLQAFMHMTLHTPKFTDYILPYVLATLAVISVVIGSMQ